VNVSHATTRRPSGDLLAKRETLPNGARIGPSRALIDRREAAPQGKKPLSNMWPWRGERFASAEALIAVMDKPS